MYDTFLQQLVQINFLPLCIIIFLIIFIWFNDVYEHQVTQMFIRPMFFLIVLIYDQSNDSNSDQYDQSRCCPENVIFLHPQTSINRVGLLLLDSAGHLAYRTNKRSHTDCVQ